MAKKRKQVKHDRSGRTGGRKSPAPSELEMHQRILAAYMLGRDSHLWRFDRKLGIDELPDGLRLWKGIQDGIATLADRIYPRVLVELLGGRLAVQKRLDHVTKSGSPDESEAICAAWFHSLVGRALDGALRLGPWFQLGDAIGAFQAAVLDRPLTLPPGGLGGLIHAAQSLTAEGNCQMAELNTMAAGVNDLAGQGNMAFLDGVLGRDHEPDPDDAELEAMILYGGVCKLDRRVVQTLLQDAGQRSAKSDLGSGMFRYHGISETRPDAFAHGPLSGEQVELARWIFASNKSPRRLADLVDKVIWIQKQHRTLYHAYFTDKAFYEQAQGRNQAEQAAASAPVESK
jgi:hypothetical protein